MIELFDAQMRFVRPIDTALRCGYTQVLSGLPSADLVLAADDPANDDILVPASFLRLTDGDELAGLYRFESIDPQITGTGATITYRLEGAQATLLDDMLIGWHELGGTGLDTRWVLEYILSRQTVRRWNLGQCDFSDYFQYNFEDVSLLEAIMSLGEVLTAPHQFVFEADGPPPWTLHLIRLSSTPGSVLVSGRNLPGITRRVDGRIVTRLVGRGYGEGDNQLTIAPVNGGLDYLDADTIGTWGVRVGVHADRRQTDPATLMARMAAILESGKNPRESFEGSVIDFSRATGERWDLHRVGDLVMILDSALDRTIRARVTQREKADIEGDPGNVVLTLDNSVSDTADELNEVLDKIGVQELYSQGATNLYSMQISDSADASHPLTMRFYVPGNVLRINSCLLSWKLERFRSYATLAASGGASTRTSSEGGGATVTLPAQTVRVEMSSGGAIDTDGGSVTLTSRAGSHRHSATLSGRMSGHGHTLSSSSTQTGGLVSTPDQTVSGNTGYSGEHDHDITHLHSITHQHVIPPMSFTLEGHRHDVTLPDHTHELTHGIYEGSMAANVTLRVDGEEVPQSAMGDGNELDVSAWLRKTQDGKIVRSTWHEVEFVPDKLTRITANLFFQVFIQSRGAGDF